MGLGVGGLRVMKVVGREQRQAEIGGQAQQVLHGLALDIDAMVHDFAVEVLCTQDVTELRRRRDRLAVLTLAKPGLDLAAGTTRRADQTLAVGSQQLPVDARLERKSTRLNSSHLGIAYGVFCLKKQTATKIRYPRPLVCGAVLGTVTAPATA